MRLIDILFPGLREDWSELWPVYRFFGVLLLACALIAGMVMACRA